MFATGVCFKLLALAGLSLAAAPRGPTWGYENDGALEWVNNGFITCEGTAQSPIDIQIEGVSMNSNLTEFQLSGYNGTLDLVMTNNGHTAVINIDGDLYIEKGGLPEAYKLAQFHFHWGSDNSKGSEHTVNGHEFPMEVHFVHYKNSSGSIGGAIGDSDGLAVLGFFFEVSDTPNSNYDDILNHLTNISDPSGNSTTVTLTPQTLSELMPSNLTNYFRYPGGLTTPPCSEVVIWTVFEDTIKISSDQLARFRALYSSETDNNGTQYHLQNNYRPVQNIASRQVQSSFIVPTGPISPTSPSNYTSPINSTSPTNDTSPSNYTSPINPTSTESLDPVSSDEAVSITMFTIISSYIASFVNTNYLT